MVDQTIAEDLDRMSVKILETIRSHGGAATTTEIKNSLGVESTDYVNYRKRAHLEPHGLVDEFQQKQDGGGGLPPLELSLTEKGLDFLDNVDEDNDEFRDLGERVNMMEDQLSAIQEQLANLDEGDNHTDSDTGSSEQMMDLSETVEALSSEVGEFASRLDEVESELNSLSESLYFTPKMKTQLDAVITFSSVFKEIMESEHGQDKLKEMFSQKRDEVKTFDESG